MGSTIWWSRCCGNLARELFFDAVAIRPGKPVVFRDLVKASPCSTAGHPVSTMVTFELFVQAGGRYSGWSGGSAAGVVQGVLTAPLSEKPGLTQFFAGASLHGLMRRRRFRRLCGKGRVTLWLWRMQIVLWWCRRSGERIEAGERVQILMRGTC